MLDSFDILLWSGSSIISGVHGQGYHDNVFDAVVQHWICGHGVIME